MGKIQIHELDTTVAVVGGTGNVTSDYCHGILNQIIIDPPNNTDVFSFSITNSRGFVIHYSEGHTGYTDRVTDLSVRGAFTITIFDANPASGTFNIYASIQDRF